jgi:hypothetical protein
MTPWRGLRRHARLFHSVQMNPASWSAFAVLCLVGAGAGAGGARLAELPIGLGLTGGALAVLAGLLILDRRRLARLRDHGAPGR